MKTLTFCRGLHVNLFAQTWIRGPKQDFESSSSQFEGRVRPQLVFRVNLQKLNSNQSFLFLSCSRTKKKMLWWGLLLTREHCLHQMVQTIWSVQCNGKIRLAFGSKQLRKVNRSSVRITNKGPTESLEFFFFFSPETRLWFSGTELEKKKLRYCCS